MIRAIIGREFRWRELLFWTFLLAAFQSIESAEPRRQIMGVVEAAAFLLVAIPSAGKLDGLGLEFTAWNPLGIRAATASVATGLLAGAIIVGFALCCHQPLGVESGWNGAVLAVFLGPVLEEVVFRGYLMTASLQLERRFSRKEEGWASVVGVALVFMFAHGARTGTTGIQLSCIMMTGSVYGFIRLRLQSTLAAVLAHGSYNLALFLSFWIGILFWFSVKMREDFSPKGRRFRPSGGDFQGIGIYRSDVFFFLEVCGRRRLRIAPD
jgi:membrane protease YdiL (CAAX protease family)